MSSIAREIKEWNTPLLGAFLLWNFTRGYESSADGKHPAFLLHFIVLPVLTSPELSSAISAHRKSFASYVASFAGDGRSDILAKLDQRVFAQRTNTLLALEIAVAAHLLRWDNDKRHLCALDVDEESVAKLVSKSNLGMAKKAFRFGVWIAHVPLSLVATSLGVKLS